MKETIKCRLTWLLGGLAVCHVLSAPGVAQVITPEVTTDNTLSTVVTPLADGVTFTIGGGERQGNNLFHSFDQFSVPTNGIAAFTNATDITNILGRVTGGNVSNIDGTITAAGSANLFLLNPSGIVFGPNAQLAIGGSFVSSTAESLSFNDGKEFTAIRGTEPPLLSISSPVGLQFGTLSQGIEVREDAGYSVVSDFPPILNSLTGLRVNPNQSFVLAGNNITLNGGIIAAPAGRISLASVQSGQVTLNPSTWALNVDNVQQWGNIHLSNRALIDASGVPDMFLPPGLPIAAQQFIQRAGTIDIQAGNFSATEGSHGLSYNFSDLPPGAIQVRAREAIELSGINTDMPMAGNDPVSTGFTTFATGHGHGADITLYAPQLSITQGAGINTVNSGTGHGGNINLVITENLFTTGIAATSNDGLQTVTVGNGAAGDINLGAHNAPIREILITGENVLSQTAGLGQGAGGDVNVHADKIFLSALGGISAATNSAGPGGSLFISAQEIDIISEQETALFPSGFGAVAVSTGDAGNLTVNTQQLRLRGDARIDNSTFAAGDAGNLTVNTQRLIVSDRARINASTFASGNAGTLTINATESIDIQGTSNNTQTSTTINSSANIFNDDALARFFVLQNVRVPIPADLSGTAGGVTINTPTLSISDGAQVSVRNEGPGDAGVLRINADRVQLVNQASITASTQQGSGGNLALNVRESLLLRQGSQLSAEARGAGNGGDITLNVPVLVSTENSDIIASALRGNGGNIQLNSQAIIGTNVRDTLTPASDITASSEFGVSGVVNLTTPEVDPSEGTTQLPSEVSDSSQHILASCTDRTNRFVASGRGGLPTNPAQSIENSRLWQDLRVPSNLTSNRGLSDISAVEINEPTPSTDRTLLAHILPETTPLVEANHWQLSAEGNLVLVANNKLEQQPMVASANCLTTAS